MDDLAARIPEGKRLRSVMGKLLPQQPTWLSSISLVDLKQLPYRDGDPNKQAVHFLFVDISCRCPKQRSGADLFVRKKQADQSIGNYIPDLMAQGVNG